MALVPRPAATLILLRSGTGGLETLMLQRAKTAAFLGGAYVFPGGAIDAADSEARRVLGLTDAQASGRLGLTSGALAYYVAAVRECFEEAGVLLACDARGKLVSAARAQKLIPYEGAADWFTLEPRPESGKPSGSRDGGQAPVWMERVESFVTLHTASPLRVRFLYVLVFV